MEVDLNGADQENAAPKKHACPAFKINATKISKKLLKKQVPFVCYLCGQLYRSAVALEEHLKKTHV